MQRRFIGFLPRNDPMRHFLNQDVLWAALGRAVDGPIWEVEALDSGHAVYLYTEQKSRTSVVGKFFGRKARQHAHPDPHASSVRWMWQEYHSLQQAYGLGFDAPPFFVVRPLATNPAIDAVLVEEHVTGRSLGTALANAVWSNDESALTHILDQMAHFLAQLHDRSLRPTATDGAPELAYLAKIVQQLWERGVIDGAHQQWLLGLGEHWRASGHLHTPTQVLIHGDVTPANFLFTAEGHLVAIDLERMHLADRTVDLGCMAAELRHWFLGYQGSWERGERAIRFFYSRYQAALNLSEERMAEIHTRGRFFQGVYLLRIARNEWLDMPYRRQLVQEGEACLRR